MSVLRKIGFKLFIVSVAFISQINAQTINSPFSPNPPVTKKVDEKAKKTDVEIIENDSDEVFSNKRNQTKNGDLAKNINNASVSEKTREIVKQANRQKLPLTEIYKVGIGDVLYINLQDTTAKYYTVLMDGTIDYPLAGKLVSVVDLTTDEIEELLREKIKLYQNPQITVKVREYASHKIKVEGLAKAGDYFLQREAIPLVVVKTMVNADSKADKVVLERENSDPRELDLKNSENDNFLIQKGDLLRFETGNISTNSLSADKSQYYYFGEKVCSGGKKEFHNGITLIQAVFNACGGLNDKLKEIKILRKAENGNFIALKFNVKEILQNKQADPQIQPGDMIDEDR